MQAYASSHSIDTSWGGYVTAGINISVTYPSNTQAKITVTGRAGFYWVDAWAGASISVTLKQGNTTISGSGSYSGSIYGGTGNENYIVDSSEYASHEFTVNRPTGSDATYTGYCTLIVGGGTSTVSKSITVSKVPYSACGAPTSVTVSSSIIAPSTNLTLSWSGATEGTSNAITGYNVYRSTSASGTYTKLNSTTIETTSFTVKSHATRGSSYYYKVQTIGTQSGYDSGQSSVYASVKTNSLPPAPTISYSGPSVLTSSQTASTATATTGTEPDGQSQTIYYNTSDSHDGQSTYSSAISLNPSAGNTTIWYFWSYDGLEYSSASTVTVKRNNAPNLTFGDPTKITRVSAKATNADYTTSITIPITITSGTYGTTSKKIYYRIVYKAGKTNPTSSGSVGSWNTLNKTTDGTYSITINANSLLGAPGASGTSWKIQAYYNDGIESTTTKNYPDSASSYYFLAPAPDASAIYNQWGDSNLYNTTTFYNKVRIKFGYDTDITSISKVTYRVGSGTENNATVSASKVDANASNPTANYIDLTLPNTLSPNTNYTFKVYANNGYFDKTFEIAKTQVAAVSINSLSETPVTWKPYTWNGNLVFVAGVTGIASSSFYTTYSLDSSSCFKIYLKSGSTRLEVAQSYFTSTTTTDQITFTCNCSTNGTNLLSLVKTNNPLGNNYNTNYNISWVFEVINLFGKVVSFETATTYKVDFYESVTQPTIKVELSNSAGSVWTELTANEGWRPQETGKFRFTSTCTSYNTTSISSIIQINRSSTTTQGSWSDYDKVSTQAMTRSAGSVGFLTPYTFTRTDIVTIPELTTNDYVWFRSKVTRGSETALTSAASKRTRLIYHYQATNFVLNSAEYAGGSTPTFTGSANCSVTGAGYSASEYTQTWEKKLLLSPTNTWTTSAESSMYTKVLTTGSNSTIPTATTYSVLASDLSTNPGTSWERLYTKIKLTTTITQTVGTVTITTTKITYTEPYLITYNTLPTILYKKNKLGINTKSITSSEALAIHSATNNQSVNIYLDNGQIGSISLSNGTLSKFIVGGGTWTGTTAAATSTINQLIIKKGAAAPTTNNLTSYEVGYATNTQTLYINDNGTIRPIGNSAIAQMAITGSYNLNELTVGNLVVTGNASFTNNIQANTINGKKPAEIIFGTTAPSKTENVLWIDTASSMYIPKVYYSSTWHPLGAVFS